MLWFLDVYFFIDLLLCPPLLVLISLSLHFFDMNINANSYSSNKLLASWLKKRLPSFFLCFFYWIREHTSRFFSVCTVMECHKKQDEYLLCLKLQSHGACWSVLQFWSVFHRLPTFVPIYWYADFIHVSWCVLVQTKMSGSGTLWYQEIMEHTLRKLNSQWFSLLVPCTTAWITRDVLIIFILGTEQNISSLVAR